MKNINWVLVSCPASNNGQSGVSFAGSLRCKKTYVAMAMLVFCALTSHKIYDRLTRHLRLDTTLVLCPASNNGQSRVSFAESPRCKKTYIAMAMRVFCALTFQKIYDRLTQHLRLYTTLVLWFFFSSSTAYAQVPVEVMVGHNQLQHEFFFFKDLDKKQKWNLFSIGSFVMDYESEDKNFSQISSQVTYNLSKSWGISGGAFSFNQAIAPIVAMSYTYSSPNEDLYINLFPTFILDDELSYELFGLFFYTPKISDELSFFGQFVTRTVYDNELSNHVNSNHQLRVGFSFKALLQFGVGFNQEFEGVDFKSRNNTGLFIRKEL